MPFQFCATDRSVPKLLLYSLIVTLVLPSNQEPSHFTSLLEYWSGESSPLLSQLVSLRHFLAGLSTLCNFQHILRSIRH